MFSPFLGYDLRANFFLLALFLFQGTYLSALRCARCHEGWVLPEDPLSHDSSWCCDSCRCPVPSWRVAEVTEEVGNTVRLLDASPEISVDQCQV